MNTQTASKLAKIIEQLQAIHDELASDSKLSPDRLKLIEDGVCLHCGREITSEQKAIRGVHEHCRQEQRRTLKGDSYFIGLGLLGPVQKTGRKPLNRLEETVKKAELNMLNKKASRKKNDK